jgi:hypothetical protein
LLLYINDLLQITNDNYKIVLFAYDSSTIITNPNSSILETSVNKIIQDINEWFNRLPPQGKMEAEAAPLKVPTDWSSPRHSRMKKTS